MSMMPNTIRDFYEWVKTRDPNETYNYYDMYSCARALYCRDRGLAYGSGDCLDKGDIECASMQEGISPAKSDLLTMGGLRREIEEHWL